jgi:hypothetical protein
MIIILASLALLSILLVIPFENEIPIILINEETNLNNSNLEMNLNEDDQNKLNRSILEIKEKQDKNHSIITDISYMGDEEEDENLNLKKIKINDKDKSFVSNEKNGSKLTLKQSILTKKFAAIFLMSVCLMYFAQMILNTYAHFAKLKNLDLTLIKTTGVIYSLINGITRPLWGILFDKFSYIILYLIITASNIIVSSALYFAADVPVLYSILVIITGFSISGGSTIFPALVAKTYGIRLSSEIFGVVAISMGLSSILSPILIFILNHESHDSNVINFLYVFLSGTVLSVIGGIICLLYKIY